MVTACGIKPTSHCTSQSDFKNGSLLLSSIREDNTSKQGFFYFIFGQLMRHTLTKLSHLYNLLQMLNSHRVVNGECFRNFSFSCKRISFDDPLSWSLSTSNGRPLYLSSRAFFPSQNFLNLHCTVLSLAVPGPNALLMLRVVSSALGPILNLNKKTTRIYFLSYIIFIV